MPNAKSSLSFALRFSALLFTCAYLVYFAGFTHSPLNLALLAAKLM